MNLVEVGFGGGCHWCTEAYFQSLKGVEKTAQGWISSAAPHNYFSEAVIIYYDPAVISLKTLIGVHLHTHAATKNHSFRKKYRSAVYVFQGGASQAQELIDEYQSGFEEKIITRAMLFQQFKINSDQQQNYYKKNKQSIFCERYIDPKLQLIENKYADFFKRI